MKNTTSNSILYAAIILAAGIITLGFSLKSGIESIASKDRYVTVKGLAEREVLADRVVLPMPYKCVGNDLQSIYTELEGYKFKIVEFLKSYGLTDEEIIVSAPNVTDREALSYRPDNMKYRYQANATVTVISDKVDKVLELMSNQGDLIKKGVVVGEEYSYQVRFEFTGLNDLKPEMIEEATKNARAVAQKFADDSESRLGGIRQANQGQFSIYPSDETTPQLKKIRVVTTVDYFLK